MKPAIKEGSTNNIHWVFAAYDEYGKLHFCNHDGDPTSNIREAALHGADKQPEGTWTKLKLLIKTSYSQTFTIL